MLALSAYMEKYGRGWVIMPHFHLESTKKRYIISIPSGYDLEYDKDGKFLPPKYGVSNFDGFAREERHGVFTEFLQSEFVRSWQKIVAYNQTRYLAASMQELL